MKHKWEYTLLAKVSKEITNGITKPQIDSITNYPVTRIETISDEKVDPFRVKFLDDISQEEIEKYRLKKGDILFSHINSIKHIALQVAPCWFCKFPAQPVRRHNRGSLKPNVRQSAFPVPGHG